MKTLFSFDSINFSESLCRYYRSVITPHLIRFNSHFAAFIMKFSTIIVPAFLAAYAIAIPIGDISQVGLQYSNLPEYLLRSLDSKAC